MINKLKTTIIGYVIVFFILGMSFHNSTLLPSWYGNLIIFLFNFNLVFFGWKVFDTVSKDEK